VVVKEEVHKGEKVKLNLQRRRIKEGEKTRILMMRKTLLEKLLAEHQSWNS